MVNRMRTLVIAASLGAGIASFASAASALPVLDALVIRNAAPPSVEQVQWRGRWGGWRGGGWGWRGGWGAPVAAGVIAGALIGGALAAPYYGYGPYYPGPYYPPPAPVYYGYPPPPPGYPPPGPGYAPPPGAAGASAGDPVAYCTQRYRSYNPQSGTYLGIDGQRHPCP
jgi:hypothetical protein